MIEVDAGALVGFVQTGMLVLARIASMLMLAPVLGDRGVPPMVRLMLVILMTVLVLPSVPPAPPLAAFSGPWVFAMLHQVLIGIAMGLTLRIVFEAFALAGELVSNGMGLGFAQLADPIRGGSSPIVGQFLIICASLLFLASGAHLTMLTGLAQSFEARPVSQSMLDPGTVRLLIDWAGTLFAGGLQLALPIVGALLAVNLALGVLGRSSPAINLMAVGFPLTLVLGLLMLQWVLPSLADLLSNWLDAAWPLMARQAGP